MIFSRSDVMGSLREMLNVTLSIAWICSHLGGEVGVVGLGWMGMAGFWVFTCFGLWFVFGSVLVFLRTSEISLCWTSVVDSPSFLLREWWELPLTF